MVRCPDGRGRTPRQRIRHLIAFMLTIAAGAVSTGCAPQPYLWCPNGFHTGKTLAPGEKQVAVHTFLYGPTYASFTMSTGRDWEGFVGLGQVGQIYPEAPILGANLGMTRSHLRFWWIRSSAGLEVEGFASGAPLYPRQDLTGAQVFATYAVGAFPKDWLGVFFPLKITYVWADWEGDISRGFGLVPGFGVTLERRHLFLRGAFNQGVAVDWPPTPDVGDLRLWYYLGLQLGYRW